MGLGRARLVVAALGIAAAGALVTGLSTGHSSSPTRLATPRPAIASPDSAIAFAVRAVRVLNSPAMLDPSHRAAEFAAYLALDTAALMNRFTPSVGFEQVTGLASDRSSGRPAIAAVVPVAAAATSLTESTAHVSVWAISVVGTTKLGQLVESWSTETLVLQTDNRGWRVARYTSSPGPVPAATQAPTSIESALLTTQFMQDVSDDSQP